MYFAKDEIIELNDNRKYLVLDSVVLDDKVYYKLREVNEDETDLIGSPIYINTVNEEGKIYINDKLESEELEKIKELFES